MEKHLKRNINPAKKHDVSASPCRHYQMQIVKVES